MEHKGAGGLRPVLVLAGVVHRHRQLGLVQAAVGQLLVGGVVGHIVGQLQGLEGAQVPLHQAGVQGQALPVLLGEVDVVLAVGQAAVLLPGNGVVLFPGKGQAGDLSPVRYLVVGDQAAEIGIIHVQGVADRQVHVAVPGGDIPLLVHVAVVAQLDGIALLLRGQLDGAGGVVQTVLGVVLHVGDDKGRAEGLKLPQQLLDLLPVHREGLVIVVEPAVAVPVEGQGLPLVFPGQGLDGIRVDFQHRLPALGDLLLPLLQVEHREGGDAGRGQHPQQDIQPLSTVHSDSSFSSGSRRCPRPGRAGGTPRSSRSAAGRTWRR